MRLLAASVVVGALTLLSPAAAVVDAGSQQDVVSPRQVVRSGDGLLTLTIPRGAVTKKVRIRIRTLKPSVLIGELRKAAAPGPVYELLPDGLRFAKPITITRRVKGLDLRRGVPLLLPASRQGNGRWTVLGNPRVERRGNVVTTTGTTRHFSEIAAFMGAVRVSLTPEQAKLAVGAEFTATVLSSALRGDYRFLGSLWTGDGSIAVVAQRKHRFDGLPEADLECATAGEGSYHVRFRLEDNGGLFKFVILFGGPKSEGPSIVTLTLHGTAECRAADAPPLDFALAFGHPAGSSFSLICAEITAASGAALQLDATGPAGYTASGTLQLKQKETAIASGTFSFRIFQVGTYTVRITATVGGRSVTTTKTVEVTGAPGSPSCGR